MTAKRFRFNGMSNCIEYDNESILLDSYGEDIAELLNELHEENENLKDVNAQCCNDYSAMRRDVLRYKEENERLHQQLFYDGDDVCGICKHEYLVPSGDYFIGKCKKGHKECSKEDIKYCEDFEKELEE